MDSSANVAGDTIGRVALSYILSLLRMGGAEQVKLVLLKAFSP